MASLTPLRRWFVGPEQPPKRSWCPNIDAMLFEQELRREHKAKVKHAKYTARRQQREQAAAAQQEQQQKEQSTMPMPSRKAKFSIEHSDPSQLKRYIAGRKLPADVGAQLLANAEAAPRPWEHSADQVLQRRHLQAYDESERALRWMEQEERRERDELGRKLRKTAINARAADPQQVHARLRELGIGGVITDSVAPIQPVREPTLHPAVRPDRTWQESQARAARQRPAQGWSTPTEIVDEVHGAVSADGRSIDMRKLSQAAFSAALKHRYGIGE